MNKEGTMAVEKIRKGRKIIGYKVRLPALDGKHQWETQNFMCKDWDDAKDAAETEHSKKKKQRLRRKHGLWPGIEELQAYSVRDLIRSFMHNSEYLIQNTDKEYNNKLELLRACSLPMNRCHVIWNFSELRICEMKLSEFNSQVAERYKDNKLSETYKTNGSQKVKDYTPRTVKDEIILIQKAWKWGKKTIDSLINLPNPWEGDAGRVTGSTLGAREEELYLEELPALLKACDECLRGNEYYLKLAILLAIHTALRRQEIVDLCWEHVDFQRRRITVTKTKTDYKTGRKGFETVLPLPIQFLLEQLWSDLSREEKPTGEIIPKSGDAISDAFDKAIVRARITRNVRFHDLRRTANTYLNPILNVEERNMMRGKARNRDMDARYTGNSLLNGIQDKLDRHFLGGKTLEEARATPEWQPDASHFHFIYR
jgi:integrase